jgi:hypothetical protein
MEAYGRRQKLKKNYIDCHPKKIGKGWINWWEDDYKYSNKRTRKLNKIKMEKQDDI